MTTPLTPEQIRKSTAWALTTWLNTVTDFGPGKPSQDDVDMANAAATTLLQQVGVLPPDAIVEEMAHDHDDWVWIQAVWSDGVRRECYASATTGEILRVRED